MRPSALVICFLESHPSPGQKSSSGESPTANLQQDVKATGITENSTANVTALIPRKLLFGNPENARVQISSNGRWISYLAPLKGVLNTWIADRPRWRTFPRQGRSPRTHPEA
jgi:hypothetical protein